MIGLLLLKHIHGLSEEAVRARWVHDPYFQYFTGETSFQHERSGMTHWRKRIGDRLDALLAESLRVAHATGAVKAKDLERITVDTTVQSKAVTFPTDAKLMHKAVVMLARDIRRKTAHDPALREAFAIPLSRADQVRRQDRRQRGRKLYSLHAPEVECTRLREARFGGRREVGKGKAHRPYELGSKVSIATTNRRAKGGQFVVHARAFHGNPCDGHTLGQMIAETQALTGIEIERVYVGKRYRGHNAPKPLRVFRSGQKRGVFGTIRRKLYRHSAIEAVIGHLKSDGHLGRNFLKDTDGDRANAVLTAAGDTFRLILKWL